jgi:hypothetical protein
MLNVGTLRMLGACFNRMPKFDAVAWNDNTLNARHWDCLTKCNGKGCSQFLSPLWGWLMDVQVFMAIEAAGRHVYEQLFQEFVSIFLGSNPH